jgi:phosphatidylserine/phosphatidylglycerophosphate/cardiolipin synthase-like enzyme
VERALGAAVSRGVSVHALIAHTNRAGEDNLRKLEMRLLGQGITVARTADDLVRYHAKMMLIDHRELFLLAFNLTHQDLDRTRSFGIVTRSRDLVREAGRLFEADVKRHPYDAGSDRFVVSPVNARKQLAAFLKGAKKQLLIYDPEVSDPGMVRLLEERAKVGVDVRVIGKVRKTNGLAVRKLSMRLHTRTIIRDGKSAFIGSQSLRELELDSRREVGVIFRDGKIVAKLAEVFQQDWEQKAAVSNGDATPVAKVAKKVAKAVAQDLPPVTPMLNQAVREVVGVDGTIEFDGSEVESVVKDAVKEAVRAAVKGAVERT